MLDGYPFIFQMNDRSCSDNLLEYVMQYRFKSEKSHHTYIVRVERYVAEDERDVAGKATRRFQFYSDFTLSVVSSKIFQHYRNDHLSLYVLMNKQYVEDMEAYKNRITAHVVKAMLG